MSEKNKFLEQLENGKVGTPEQIADLKESIAVHKKNYELTQQMHDNRIALAKVITDNPKKLSPDYEFHNVDEYWSLEVQKELLKLEQEKLQHNLNMKQLQQTIDSKEKELERLEGDKDE